MASVQDILLLYNHLFVHNFFNSETFKIHQFISNAFENQSIHCLCIFFFLIIISCFTAITQFRICNKQYFFFETEEKTQQHFKLRLIDL